MTYTDKQKELDEFMRERLPEKRLRHSAGVSKMAVRLAKIYGADVEKARFAGQYHDIAKAFTQEESDSLIRKYGLPERYIGNRSTAHSKVGAALLEHEFGVSDREILDAVSTHTTGAAGMPLLSEIIFVADAVDETRSYEDVDYYRDLAVSDLDRACLEIMEFNIRHITAKGKELDTDTVSACEYMKEKIRSKNLIGTYEAAKAIAKKLSDRKAKDIVIINIGEKSSFADYFVNATASSERQLGALMEDVYDSAVGLGIEPKNVEGRAGTGWILLDCGDIIVNLFTADTRDRYALDKIWSDCETEAIEE